jgi:hypothetical protein
MSGHKLRIALAVPLFVLLSACGHFGRSSGTTTIKADLQDVVDAVQFAVDAAAKENAWKATEQEQEHWGTACKAAKAEAAKSCTAMVDDADALCKARCPSGTCNPVQQQICTGLATGKNTSALCPKDAATSPWCRNAMACNEKTQTAAQVCKSADTLTMPELKHAVLNVAVERSSGGTAAVNLLVVSFGGSHTQTAANSVELTLKPRVRDRAYGSAILPDDILKKLPAVPGERVTSAKAVNLAGDLKQTIVDAVNSTVREYTSGKTEKPPMSLANLEIEFSLTVDDSGKLGLKQAWAGPLSLELGGGAGIKRINTLKIVYARPT